MIGIKIQKPVENLETYSQCAQWCNENQGDDNARAIKFNRDHAKTTSIRMVGSANPIVVSWYACGY